MSPSTPSEAEGAVVPVPARCIAPNAVLAAAAEVAPVPPLAIGKVPVTPGLGLAVKIEVAVVDARFINIDGAAVKPVPPCETANVPVIPGRGFAVKIDVAVVDERFTSNEGAVVNPEPPLDVGRTPVISVPLRI